MFLPANITLKFGDSGDFVSELQRRLATVHCFSAEAVNGFFDGTTVNGVSTFQSMSGIRADGIAGPETLRRLNGVISGDTSTNTHDADQDRLRQEEMTRQLLQQEILVQQQQAEQQRFAAEQLSAERATQAQSWQQNQLPQPPEIQYAQEAAYAQHHAHEPQQQMMAAETAQQVQMHHHVAHAQHATAMSPAVPQNAAKTGQPAAEVQHQQPAAHVQPQAQAIPVQHSQPQAQQHQPAAHSQPQAQAVPVHHAQQAPVAMQILTPQPTAAAVAAQAAMAAQQPHQAVAQSPAAATPAVAEAAATPKGIVGRAMQYANDMVQKLSHYFESKLPTNVIAEVKDIGLNMAKSGVREAALPTGPENQRGAEAPARGPQQQQQVPHRG